MFTCVFSELRGEMIVHFVDIGGIDDHQQFKLSFHNTLLYNDLSFEGSFNNK
jgi:hypothetical protein